MHAQLTKAKEVINTLNEDNFFLALICRELIENREGSHLYEQAKARYLSRVGERTQDIVMAERCRKLLESCRIEAQKNELRRLKREKEQQSKATLRFTGDQFAFFMETIRRKYRECEEVQIQFENGKPEFTINFLGVKDEHHG